MNELVNLGILEDHEDFQHVLENGDINSSKRVDL